MEFNYRYYSGEKTSPFSDQLRSNFWHGEKMFETTVMDKELWVKNGDATKEALRQAGDEDRLTIAESYTREEFGVIIYIEELFLKWQPYDDTFWLFEY